MAPSSVTYSPFLMESYHFANAGNGTSTAASFSSPASFFSGCPDTASDDDIYSSLSHLPSSSISAASLTGKTMATHTHPPDRHTHARGSSFSPASRDHPLDEIDEEHDDSSDDDNEMHDSCRTDDPSSFAGLWNCLVCTRLNQNDQCVFCGQGKDAPFQPVRQVDAGATAPSEAKPTYTAIGYDDRMRLHREVQPRDLLDVHPERPDRIAAIFAQCQHDGLVQRCTHIPSVLVDRSDLLRCHDDAYLAQLDELCKLPHHHLTPDTYCCSDTGIAAHLSAGIVLSLVDKVVHNQARNGFAIVRPPGHHAESSHAMGFCMFNNVAVAAKAAVAKFGLSRVLILDWDIHHGNGTEHMFEDDPTVLYCSLHRYDNQGAFYPGTGAPNSVGSGAGAGFNVNVGWPCGGVGDAEYLAAFDSLLMPIFRAYAPELVLVSAGFDSALGDPLGRCRLTPPGYAHLTHMLSSLAGGKIVLALEGGYNLKSIAMSASACLRILLGDPVPLLPPDTGPPMASALHAIERTRRCLQPYWPCLLSVSSEDEEDADASNDDEEINDAAAMASDEDDRAEASAQGQGRRRRRTRVDSSSSSSSGEADVNAWSDEMKPVIADKMVERARRWDEWAAKVDEAARRDPQIAVDLRAKIRESKLRQPKVAAAHAKPRQRYHPYPPLSHS
ncbi:hypothetical protein, variant 2 [Aphanomyces invadans]|nr:hypothetical protein, variant 1 [Aphanomyces invadans]XP_008878311.1 hypothetical protein, variant 2 [Aphanomyces invadans]ETV93043.1 hypothetical protein, variant 1 [Aphanomyces invadans]ETV93044.1 hypothetical protein, variant 2 [Aphanomyces invadans]|eukprot:XP_008878310.1 hypothetical protein, variant 1 [Aphanomyces invadans]